jgi:hypothetical protein
MYIYYMYNNDCVYKINVIYTTHIIMYIPRLSCGWTLTSEHRRWPLEHL